ncbi:uncharacterized protein LOC109843252 [Asparagus officinalis]|nr:uncharacterized protein LOC109843252 [Asparagus officinalis]
MEEMGMFLYRISDARVIGVGNLLASQGCVSLTEGENGTSLQGQVTICHPPEVENITEKPTEEQASDTLLKEGQVIEELAPGSIDNGGEYAQTSRGISIQSADGYEMTSRSTENYRQPEIWSFSQGVSKARPVDYEAASVL